MGQELEDRRLLEGKTIVKKMNMGAPWGKMKK